MDRRTSSTAGPTCASCEECTAGATINVGAHAAALNRCVRRTVSHGISRATDRIHGHIASARERARERLNAARRRASSFWDGLTERITGGSSRLFDDLQGGVGTAPKTIGAKQAVVAASGLSLAALAGVAGRRALRARWSSGSFGGDGADGAGLLE
mmetsp:Transcript_56629/g.168530  ORF Transcript_56629/g.168530 Transcript_56629/m.168530 type:complete len:156 (+) Transcript_56629:198-665(+)